MKPHLTIDHFRGRIHSFESIGCFDALDLTLGLGKSDRWQQQGDNEQKELSEYACNWIGKPAKTAEWLSCFRIA